MKCKESKIVAIKSIYKSLIFLHLGSLHLMLRLFTHDTAATLGCNYSFY